MSDLPFGKRTVVESFFNGQLKSTKTEYSIPELIKTRSDALSEIMKCLELIDSKQTNHITIAVQADPKTHAIRLITKNYVVDK
jgi:Asp/Glu/hydantoin racemase